MSQDKTPPAKDAGAEYAEIWGEAVHNQPSPSDDHRGARELRVILLIIVVIRIASVDPPRPIVVRVDEIGRAEAVAYDGDGGPGRSARPDHQILSQSFRL